MKKAPMIILIPAAAVMLVVVAAMLIKMFGTPPDKKASESAGYPNAVENSAAGKPTNFLGSLFGMEKPTPTPNTAVNLSNELKNTVDDGGRADLDAIQKDSDAL